MYSMVIQLKTILGPPEGFPRSSRWLPRVRNPAQVPPQWPTVAHSGLQWPHPPGRTSWQKLIDHLLLFIRCTILQHSDPPTVHYQPQHGLLHALLHLFVPQYTFYPLWVGAKMHRSAFQWAECVSDHLVALSFTHSISGFDWN